VGLDQDRVNQPQQGFGSRRRRRNGLTSCQTDITHTSITVSYDREDAVPLTAMRIVRTSRPDYTRLQGITDLARAVSTGDLDVEEAHRRLDRVVSAPATYRRTMNALAWASVAGCFGFLLGGGWSEPSSRR
jgi:uncharacterized membrane protein YjjP (DUF1212 family)